MGVRRGRGPLLISPTSTSLLRRCHRAWWYTYVLRRPRTSTPAAHNGSSVHAAVECYLASGTWPPTDVPPVVQARRAQGVLDAWRARSGLVDGTGTAVVEAAAAMDLTPYGGVDALAGRVDWSGEYDTTTEDDGTGAPRTAWVLDHKTTANPAYWLDPERLGTDPQLLAYAGALFPGRTVLVGHVYIPPPPTEPTLVLGVATPAAIEATLRTYAAATLEMAGLRAVPTAEEVPATGSLGGARGCWAYGGCPHVDICTAAPDALRRRLDHEANETTNNAGKPMALTDKQIEMRAKMSGKTVAEVRAGLGLDAPAPPPPPPALTGAVVLSHPPTAPETALSGVGTPDGTSGPSEDAGHPTTPAPTDAVTPPDAPDDDPAPTEDDPLALARRAAAGLVGRVTQRAARASLAARLGRPGIPAALWGRVVDEGVEGGLWAQEGKDLVVSGGEVAHTPIPTTALPTVTVVEVPPALSAAWDRYLCARRGLLGDGPMIDLPLYLYDALVVALGAGS